MTIASKREAPATNEFLGSIPRGANDFGWYADDGSTIVLSNPLARTQSYVSALDERPIPVPPVGRSEELPPELAALPRGG